MKQISSNWNKIQNIICKYKFIVT